MEATGMNTERQNGNIQKLAWGLNEAAESCGVSVAYLRKIIANGEIRPTKAGRRVLIADSELRRWLSDNGAQAA